MDTFTTLGQQAETFYMTDKDKLRENIMPHVVSGALTAGSAADTLGLSWRQVMRLKARFIKNGVLGILHTSRGKVSHRKLTKPDTTKALQLITDHYADFGPTLVKEKLQTIHHLNISTESLRQLMIQAGLWTPRPAAPNKKSHTWRARKDCFGEMEQYDGSYYDWFEGRLKDSGEEICLEQCLLASIDDAAGTITYVRFADSEGVLPTFTFWTEYMKKQGKPVSIYLDRFSTYKNNMKKNTKEILDPTQFERAMNQLGVRVIHAYSPQAKGRIERLFQTLQYRLVKELRLGNICTMAKANVFLETVFMPEFNKKFAVLPKVATNLHRKLSQAEEIDLPMICSIQNVRTIKNDYTVSHQTHLYQINPRQTRLIRVSDEVVVCTKMDGTQSILKNGQDLEFTEIKSRATRLAVVPVKKQKPHLGYKPAPNHPWRHNFIIKTQMSQLVGV